MPQAGAVPKTPDDVKKIVEDLLTTPDQDYHTWPLDNFHSALPEHQKAIRVSLIEIIQDKTRDLWVRCEAAQCLLDHFVVPTAMESIIHSALSHFYFANQNQEKNQENGASIAGARERLLGNISRSVYEIKKLSGPSVGYEWEWYRDESGRLTRRLKTNAHFSSVGRLSIPGVFKFEK